MNDIQIKKRTTKVSTYGRHNAVHQIQQAPPEKPPRAKEIRLTKRNTDSTTSRTSPASREREDNMREFTPKRRRRSYSIWVLSIVVITISAVVFSIAFSGAKVTVYPKTASVHIDGTFTAENSIAGRQITLPFQIMELKEVASRTVPSVKEATRKDLASGTITIYNSFSEESQRLITDTRFESESGKIYRIHSPVSVPGYTKKSDGSIVPGSITATVYADTPGEEFNIATSTFTIPGFKGSPRFTSFSATVKTPIIGGYNGIQKIADDATIKQAIEEMRNDLTATVRKKATNEAPEGFITNDTLIITSQSSEQPKNDLKNGVILTEKMTAFVILIPEKQLTEKIAQAILNEYKNEPVVIENIRELAIGYVKSSVEGEEGIVPEKITISVKGTPFFRFEFDSDKLKKDLVRKNKQAMYGLLSSYPSIVRAEVTLRPFWARSFPESIDEITVVRAID